MGQRRLAVCWKHCHGALEEKDFSTFIPLKSRYSVYTSSCSEKKKSSIRPVWAPWALFYQYRCLRPVTHTCSSCESLFLYPKEIIFYTALKGSGKWFFTQLWKDQGNIFLTLAPEHLLIQLNEVNKPILMQWGVSEVSLALQPWPKEEESGTWHWLLGFCPLLWEAVYSSACDTVLHPGPFSLWVTAILIWMVFNSGSF